jgi:hypothetical protein
MPNLLPFAVISALCASTVTARGTASPILDSLLACRGETDDAKRLACADKGLEALAAATATKEVQVVTREDVRQTRRSLFGFGLPKLPLFSNDDSANETPDEVETTIRSARSDGYGKFTFVLVDGAVWRTTEAVRGKPTANDRIRIKRAALGSYKVKINGGPAVRALRVG